ncbi:hypothetical protein D9619_002042 [Psilocybe cf. subviscida]|uniref:NACHT domain-containing protein n=1 Tax=Psilocybe cf. subviscida TaxID=2480587 RepID=A0A8H5BFP6_9AGAR|nr:hypothetical protein D9619_002042 [Psilocybe cf. subviscida]
MTQRARSQRRSVNFLQSASNVVITGGSFTGIQETSGQNNSLEPLYAHVSSNAILNAGGRADPVRCHPGTRDEVMRIIEKWIDGDGDLSRRIFWLSGPAGAGKTAIIQTIAERCIQHGLPMANYFFFRADSTRNHAGSVVATLLYQILEFHPGLKANIATLLDTKPLVFDQSIRDQFKYLIDTPVRTVVDGASAPTQRLLLLIDGVDECSSETKHVQGDLLHALHHLASQQNSPFIILVASRAEPHLVMTFNEIGSSNDSIFLDENYHPSRDIRLFVAAEFDKVKRTHHLGRTLDGDWPSDADVDEIVEKSSGQFIYAATVMRFISSSSASPAHSLDRVRGIRPIVKNSPFAELDAIYTHILSQVEDWGSAKNILAGQLILPTVKASDAMMGLRCTIDLLLAPLGLTQSDIESNLSDLVAVVQYSRETENVVFYHASLRDFLCDESRSKALYIDLVLFAEKLARAHIPAMTNFYNVEIFCSIFALVKTDTPLLRDALISWKPWKPETLHNCEKDQWRMRTIGHQCIVALRGLYYPYDYSFYQTILRKWLAWFSDLEIPRRDLFNDDTPEANKIWDDIQRSRSGEKTASKVAFWKKLPSLSKIRPSMK